MSSPEGERLLAGRASKSPNISRANDTAAPKAPSATKKLVLLALVVALILSGVANSVLLKVVSDSYGQRLAFFVDQANNVLYLVLAIGVVAFKLLFTKDITPEQLRFPQYKFAIMACMDASGTFLTFIGAVYTPGQYQTLLNQTLIPFTMVVAFFLLGTRYSVGEVGGAFVVICGACLAVVPSLTGGDSAGAVRWYCVLMYWLSNLPMAGSATYKEVAFKNASLDCFYLTMVVSAYQVVVSFALAPLQAVPGFGTAEGIPQHQIWSDLWNGMVCTAGTPVAGTGAECTSNTAFLLAGYTLINFTYNVLGLVLVRLGSSHGQGAVLCSIAYALKVPVTNLVFAWPAVMGSSTETLTPFTLSGLGLVTAGFAAYLVFARRRSHTAKRVKALSATEADIEADVEAEPWGLHDRVVGVVASHTTNADLTKALLAADKTV